MGIQKLEEIIKTLKNSKNKHISYKNFSGQSSEDIEEHITKFEKIASLQTWDKKTKINTYLKHINNGAYEYFINEVMNETPLTWARIKEKMTNKYKKVDDDWELIILSLIHI